MAKTEHLKAGDVFVIVASDDPSYTPGFAMRVSSIEESNQIGHVVVDFMPVWEEVYLGQISRTNLLCPMGELNESLFFMTSRKGRVACRRN